MPSSSGRKRRSLTAAALLSDFDFPKRSRQSQSQPVESTSLVEKSFPSPAFPSWALFALVEMFLTTSTAEFPGVSGVDGLTMH
jgi:hypothetical protein